MNSIVQENPLGHSRPRQHRESLRRRGRPFAHRHARRHRHAQSRQDRPRRSLSRRAHPRRLRRPAGRPGRRRDLHCDAASGPRRMGDQGGGGRQARALREADGPHRLRGRRDDPCGAQGRHLSRRGLHVPAAPADGTAGRTGQIRRDRRSADDQVELRLRHAGLHAGAPALCQRSCRRRHSRRRRLSGVDGAPDRRSRGGEALRRAGQGGRRGASRPVRRRRMGLGAAHLSGRHCRRGLLQHLARPGQCAAHLRHEGPHRGAGLLVRRRQPRRRPRQDRPDRS